MNIIWFRNDLRILDNPALFAVVQHSITQQEKCIAVYISTPEQWKLHNVAPIQIDFIERHINLLNEQLAELNIPLEHIEATDFNDQVEKLTHYCSKYNVKNVYANTEVELNEKHRDKKSLEQLSTQSTQLHLFENDVIVSKGNVLNGEGTMYKVFTPFRNAWVKQLIQHQVIITPPPLKINTINKSIKRHKAITFNAPKVCSKKWPLVTKILTHVLPQFFTEKHNEYKAYRDFPALKGTSGISPYLAIGALSPKALAVQVLLNNPNILENPKAEKFTWLNELAWRDFYKHLIFHFPNLCKHQNFQEKYNALQWPNNPEYFKAWCEGNTGYPLVDAAMKQLVTTGWMHNRLRMVVASFLTKHLLVDWRLGERFFMQHLIDGDFSANNGGWQWAAGTGCDAQPYFRVFNPITQSEKFDPDGSFIRKYIKGLENVPAKHIHFPHKYLETFGQSSLYCDPIVEHKVARLNALDFYKQQLNK